MAATRKVPIRLAEGPGFESKSSAMLRPMGSTMPALRAVIDETPDASVTSVMSSEYETPSEVCPNARTKRRAMRRARPVSSSSLAIIIAATTNHTDGSAKPPSASRIGVPLAVIAVSPIRTRADEGRGSRIIPAITQMKMAVCRHPWGVIGAGAGIRKTMTPYSTTSANRPRARDTDDDVEEATNRQWR
jgi:hypothetical protein